MLAPRLKAGISKGRPAPLTLGEKDFRRERAERAMRRIAPGSAVLRAARKVPHGRPAGTFRSLSSS
jgi:hypothetical protein